MRKHAAIDVSRQRITYIRGYNITKRKIMSLRTDYRKYKDKYVTEFTKWQHP